MSEAISFGAFFKSVRMRLDLTLREFCQKHALDPSNVSKMERGHLPPPQSRDKLEEYAAYLNLKQGSDEWYTFFDLAAAEHGRLPPDLASDEAIARQLPMIFRSLRGRKGTEKDLRAIVKLLRRS